MSHGCRFELWGCGIVYSAVDTGKPKKKIQQSQRTDQGMAESQTGQREEEAELWSAHTSSSQFYPILSHSLQPKTQPGT